MIENNYDVVVIGGGAAGMASARRTAVEGLKTVVVEREEDPGGILLQCIHDGFGLHNFKEELTGPEYAERVVASALEAGIDLQLHTTVVEITENDDKSKRVVCYSYKDGVIIYNARSVILAMGCRERNRGNLGIPGSRPAGVFTAGLAQRLLNIDGFLPGREAVIIGSGDIGLIMARRLTWVGIKVKCVIEIQPHPSGLTRNVVQCLEDFGIPLYLSHSVTQINGKERVESVDISPLEDGVPNLEETFNVECDTILLSVGLIPENELSKTAGVKLNLDTGGPYVDANQMANIDGIFACGNVLHVHDLVDYVSQEADITGRKVVEYLADQKPGTTQGKTASGANIKYVVPNNFVPGRDNHFYMRPLLTKDTAELKVSIDDKVVMTQKMRHVKPAEMISLDLSADILADYETNTTLNFSLS